jgi:hypothetical protein
MGDVGVVAVAQAVEDVVADLGVVWAVVAVEDPSSFERRLGVPVVVVVAEGGVLRAAAVGQRCEQDECFVLGEDAAPAAGGLDRLVLAGGQDVQPCADGEGLGWDPSSLPFWCGA